MGFSGLASLVIIASLEIDVLIKNAILPQLSIQYTGVPGHGATDKPYDTTDSRAIYKFGLTLVMAYGKFTIVLNGNILMGSEVADWRRGVVFISRR